MTEPRTISNAPLEHPGMDYALLRSEGIKIIEKLAGTSWTDYNAHDPGITILEALCYAITDLSYRLSFEMEDLLAYPASEPEPPPLFLTARQILTVNPLTIADYRKLLLDIEGVKNAWLEPISQPQPALYYDTNNARLTFNAQNLAEPVYLRGLYRVLLEAKPGYPETALKSAAQATLHQHRNLCEDFAEIQVLPMEEITVRAEIEIADSVNPQQFMAQLYSALDREISPSLDFVSLAELVDRGVPSADIFAGPRLDRGFIDDEQLQAFGRKSELHTSDLIHVILDRAEVKTVSKITLSSDRSLTDEAWVLKLDPQLTPRLKSIEEAIKAEDITFYKGQIPCQLDIAQVKIAIASLTQTSTGPVPSELGQDIPIPQGDYRELADYETIQSEFPLAYGIGDIGLPTSATVQRQAQAKQLQAYLLVFDQLLANYFAQLDHVKDLFAPTNLETTTYFTQSIAHFPGAETILKTGDNAVGLDSSPKKDAVNVNRKNRLLDHLLAQYGETFTDSSLLYPNDHLPTSDGNLLGAIAKGKADFAINYRSVSAGRNQSFNHTLDPNNLENIKNVSGLQRRVAQLLGIAPHRQFIGTSEQTEGFYLVEHLLLRPHSLPTADTNAPDFLSFAHAITEFQESNNPQYVTCIAPDHGLKAGDRIEILYTTHYNGTYTVINCQSDRFEISHEFIAGKTKDSGAWVASNQVSDPFSFQLSIICPDWAGRFSDRNFKQLVLDTLMAETPAHITFYIHWLNRVKMQEFETTYAIWLQQLSGNTTWNNDGENFATRLINLLKIGSTTIQRPPALLGYMTIVKNEDDNVENSFEIA